MSGEYRVNVFDDEGNVIGRVRYNADLDFWDGRNWTSGSTGMHQGITKLKDGRYVLITGTQWQGEKDSAAVVTPEEALQAILKSGHAELLDTKKFKDLKKLHAEATEEDDLEEDNDQGRRGNMENEMSKLFDRSNKRMDQIMEKLNAGETPTKEELKQIRKEQREDEKARKEIEKNLKA